MISKKGLVTTDQRICFGIAYFDSEENAAIANKEVTDRGDTYNGGMFHGMSCGRDKSWDREEDGRKLYAVTY